MIKFSIIILALLVIFGGFIQIQYYVNSSDCFDRTRNLGVEINYHPEMGCQIKLDNRWVSIDK